VQDGCVTLLSGHAHDIVMHGLAVARGLVDVDRLDGEDQT
jgi:hypothetical protein